MGLDRCKLIKYSRLSDGTHTDLDLNRKFFVSAPVLGAVQLIRGIYTILVSHRVLIQGHQDPLLLSGVFIAEELDGVLDGARTTAVDVQTLLMAF